MLVKVNQTYDADKNRVFKAEDYNLVGPDGNVYKFKTYTPDTKILANGLEAGTIIAEGGETRHLTGTANAAVSSFVNWPETIPGTKDASVVLGAALNEKNLNTVGVGSVLVAGSNFTLATISGVGQSVNITPLTGTTNNGINKITLDSDGRLSLDLTVASAGPVKVEVGKSVTLNDGTVLRNNGQGNVSIENGSLKLASALNTATGGNAVDFSVAAQSTLVDTSLVKMDNLDLVLASNLSVAKGTLDKNVTIGNSAGLGFGDINFLAKGSVLAKGSTFRTDGSAWEINIEVKGKEVKVKWDDTVGVLTVGGEMVAAGKSITLEDGTVLTHNSDLAAPTTATGNIFIEYGSVKTAEDINAYAPGTFGATISGMTVAKDSTLVAGTKLGNSMVNTVRLMAGTVITKGDADRTFSGSITFADQGKNFQFSANTGDALATRYYDLNVTDSFTFIFSKYDPASSNLNDSLMSQIGANSGQTTFLSINDMRCKALGVSDVDISTKWGAATAIETVNNALQKVSHQRSSLGALQNRLEHTIKNLDTAAENLQAAESRIRDVDMAKEVMEFTRTNILQQASQAMLAQANQQPQSVLQLLR